MSTVTSTTYDVFLSFSLTEASTADLIERALEEVDLDVFNAARLDRGAPLEDVIWRALAQSFAVVAIIDPARPPASSVLVELGAAMAWHKLVYVVHTNGGGKLPSYLAGYPAFPVSRIDDVVQSIARGRGPLSDEQHDALLASYFEMGIPSDRLLQEPAQIEELAERFQQRCGVKTSGERLIQELLRLRKRGGLPRLRSRAE